METRGLLIRVRLNSGAALALERARRSFQAADVGFELEPLFSVPSSSRGFGAADGPGWQWHLARVSGDASLAGRNPWDIAHAALSQGLALGPDTSVLVEPDLIQQWPLPPEATSGLAAADPCAFHDQDASLPKVPGHFAWHLEGGFTDLAKARALAGQAANQGPIRIAHLDTGYDPGHATRPAHLRTDLQRNFMDDGAAGDAHDPGATGLLKNPGHGTGTLGILAGNKFSPSLGGYQFNDFIGGAPEAEIVPVRVGKSVVQLYTSSVASGISYAAELCADAATEIHVISMSMGGVASQAWADAVNKAYDAGIIYVAAAGNNFSAIFFGLPTHLIVYPARFRRVIAACGVMADRRPYYGLPIGTMQGNWGPSSKMATALSAFTPNMPWATLGCSGVVDMDGQGTSAATPQVAAAAALYLQAQAAELFDRNKYPEPWMRVEAARQALFSTADHTADGGSSEKLGAGILQATRAVQTKPLTAQQLRQTAPDDASFAFLRALTGWGVAPGGNTERMLALEATQLCQRWDRKDAPNPLESILPDPDLPPEAIPMERRRAFLQAILEHPDASQTLKQHAGKLWPGTPTIRTEGMPPAEPEQPPARTAGDYALEGSRFIPVPPPARRLRGYSIDPSLTTNLDTASISTVTFRVPWEPLEPGPVGEYLEVIDTDPASGCYYEPVNLDEAALLAQDGLPPSEGTPQFHQQMVYAVSSLTIHNFERALGRRTLWAPAPPPQGESPKNDSRFLRRLRLYPHALRERNAYFSPEKMGLLFGYFRASDDDPGEHMPGGMVFTCLSHDIVAHETTHALLDGMSRAFRNATNRDVFAFHEAFADIVAMFQHFTFPEIVRHQLTNTRGDIRSQQNLLGELAGQFGRGTGRRMALRSAIGELKDGKWQPKTPNPSDYRTVEEPHLRGAILVGAVFDAFLSIFERRTADLFRLATDGTGILRPGAIDPDLVNRLSEEATKSAGHVLSMCIRALDYCPPVDITFAEYLRAIITADYDLVPDDDLRYRTAFMQAFQKRGIYQEDAKVLSEESLVWRTPDNDKVRPSAELQSGLSELRDLALASVYAESREHLFHQERELRRRIHDWLEQQLKNNPHGQADASYLGLQPKRSFEVRSARFAFRTSPDGGMVPQLLLGLIQEKGVACAGAPNDKMVFLGGSTVIADLKASRVKYCIRKSFTNEERLGLQRAFAAQAAETARATYLGPTMNEPFAALHRGC
jgi:hypothetical protein